jgi:hypothetical protein
LIPVASGVCFWAAALSTKLSLVSFGEYSEGGFLFMRRSVTLLFMMIFALSSIPTAQSAPKKTAAKSNQKPPCVADWADCPDEGCGGQFDPNLNRAKNLPSVDGEAKLHSLTWMKKLEDPENFSQGDSREELQALGEG